MFDVNTSVLADALKVSKDKIESKGIKSVRSRVTNIKDHLPNQDMTVQDFVAALKKYMSEKYEMTDFVATEEDEAAILAIQEEKITLGTGYMVKILTLILNVIEDLKLVKLKLISW